MKKIQHDKIDLSPQTGQAEHTKKKKNEKLLFFGLAAAILALFAFNQLRAAQSAVLVEVSAEGKVVESYRLDENVDTVIEGYRGGTNHLIIRDGGVSISEATCPDKVCVRQGVIRETGQSLVCLPNKVIVTIK